MNQTPRELVNAQQPAQNFDDTIRVIMAEKAAEIPPPAAPEPERMAVMRLDRNYHPAGKFEIVGHLRPEIRRKGPDGRDTVIRPEEWIAGEMSPAPRNGAGTPGKIWAGTVLKLTIDEARRIEKAKIGAPTLAD